MEMTWGIQNWRSIRHYKEEPIPEAALRAVLEAGRRAPSWCNIQPWHFIVIEDAALKDKLVRLSRGQMTIAQAPVVIAVCGDLTAWDKPKHREALYGLMEAQAISVTGEIIDNFMLSDPILAVSSSSPAAILARTFEQLGIAYGFMGIEAVNQGLGMCIIGAFSNEVTGNEKELYTVIKTELNIPDDMYLLTLLTLGLPDETPMARPRKAFTDIVSRSKVGHAF